MILVRNVFQAKYGQGDELVSVFKEFNQVLAQRNPGGSWRVLTDLSGPFFTVVAEAEFESLAAWERMTTSLFSDPEFGQWFGRMQPLVESGRREFYTIQAEP